MSIISQYGMFAECETGLWSVGESDINALCCLRVHRVLFGTAKSLSFCCHSNRPTPFKSAYPIPMIDLQQSRASKPLIPFRTSENFVNYLTTN